MLDSHWCRFVRKIPNFGEAKQAISHIPLGWNSRNSQNSILANNVKKKGNYKFQLFQRVVICQGAAQVFYVSRGDRIAISTPRDLVENCKRDWELRQSIKCIQKLAIFVASDCAERWLPLVQFRRSRTTIGNDKWELSVQSTGKKEETGIFKQRKLVFFSNPSQNASMSILWILAHPLLNNRIKSAWL